MPWTGTLLAGYSYDWNQRNQLTAIDFLPGNSEYTSPFDYSDEDVTYDYDNRGQLTDADYDALTDESYGYDDNGNRIDGDFDAGGAHNNNQIATDGTYDYEYDHEGNIVLRTKISDGSYTEYTWDHRNRLTKVTDFNDSDVEQTRVEYRYDANDQLIGRKVFLGGSGTASESGVFAYQNGQVVLQFDGTGNSDLEYGDLSHRYLWGPAVDMLLANEKIDWSDETADGPVYWALGDNLNTPRDWIDSDANVVDHAIYDSYGKRLNADAMDTNFDWTGRWRDPLTGLQWNHARWYNPSIQRWMSEDRIWDGTNRQAYVGNAPTSHTDPSGLEPTDDPREHEGEIWRPDPNWNREYTIGHLHIIFDYGWPEQDRNRVLTSLQRIHDKLSARIAEIENELGKLNSCERKELEPWLTDFKKTLEDMLSYFDSKEFDLHIQHKRLGEDGPYADSRIADLLFNNTIRYNDEGKRNWRKFDDKFLDKITFHEFLHIVNRKIIDDDSTGSLYNAFNIQDIINTGLSRNPFYDRNKKNANKDCDEGKK